jgi:hypothetical protein
MRTVWPWRPSTRNSTRLRIAGVWATRLCSIIVGSPPTGSLPLALALRSPPAGSLPLALAHNTQAPPSSDSVSTSTPGDNHIRPGATGGVTVSDNQDLGSACKTRPRASISALARPRDRLTRST